ncbi:MAG: hypothetical protein AAF645_19555 [Myxococcota bacterium]
MRSASSCVLALVLLAGATAHADEMDVDLARLRIDNGDGTFTADNANYRRLMSQLGFALISPVLAPARTTGYRGFYIGFETSVVQIDDDTDYWRRGTEGDSQSVGENRFVTATLPSSRVHLRKGLPYGLELGANFGRLYNTDTWILGAELRIALLEGFRRGSAGWLPDLAVRGAVRTLVGAEQYHLTVPIFDIVLSKPIVLGGTVTLTPIVAGQFAWILADSDAVDLTPEVNVFEQCMPTVDPEPAAPPTPLPGTGPLVDFENDQVFDDVRAFRGRLAVGMEIRYRVFTLAATFHWDLRAPGDIDSAIPDDIPRQWDLSIAVGATY